MRQATINALNKYLCDMAARGAEPVQQTIDEIIKRYEPEVPDACQQKTTGT